MQLTPGHKAKLLAGARRYTLDMQELVRQGLLVGYPGRLVPGETRVTRARKEIDRMEDQDREIERLRALGDPDALDVETHSEEWSRIHGRSLQIYRDVLAPTYQQGNADDLPWIKLQLETAHTVNRITAKFAVERYRGARASALARLLERMKPADGETIDQPDIVGFDGVA